MPVSSEDTDLQRLGLKPQAKRDIGLLAIVGLGWNICNSWAAISATLAISIASGGPVTIIYGILLIFVLGGACALSMAEIASVYPTAGGQYHWTSILAPRSISRGLVRNRRLGRLEVDADCAVELLLRRDQRDGLDCQLGRLYHSASRHHRVFGQLLASWLFPRNVAHLLAVSGDQFFLHRL